MRPHINASSGSKLYYELSQVASWIEWTGSATPWSTMTYGTAWSNEGEAIQISSINWISSTTLRVVVLFYDGYDGILGARSSYVDIYLGG